MFGELFFFFLYVPCSDVSKGEKVWVDGDFCEIGKRIRRK